VKILSLTAVEHWVPAATRGVSMSKILIKNGRVWTGREFILADILTDGAVITRIEPDICQEKAFVYDAAGKIVAPGLIDAHAHFRGVSADIYGIPAEAACFPFGVTAALDVSAVNGNRHTLDAFTVKTQVLGFISIRDDQASFTSAEKAFTEYRDKVIGLKIGLSEPTVQTIAPLQQACTYARSKGLPLMVHCTDSPVPMAEIVECLQKGDILTHPFHGGNHTAAEDQYACLKTAKEKGIWIDAGFAGHVHTDFSVLKGAIDEGIFPDTISTDITKNSAYKRGGRYGMTMCMNIARTVGMPEEAIFRAVTTTPAIMLGQAAQWGALEVGRRADIAVFQDTDEGFYLKDQAGNRLQSDTGYRCVLTIADGEVVYRY